MSMIEENDRIVCEGDLEQQREGAGISRASLPALCSVWLDNLITLCN
jgi:hypothetical protein